MSISINSEFYVFCTMKRRALSMPPCPIDDMFCRCWYCAMEPESSSSEALDRCCAKHLEAPSHRGGHGQSQADGLTEPGANIASVATVALQGEATTSIQQAQYPDPSGMRTTRTSICLCPPRTPELFRRATYADDHVEPPRRWGGLGFDFCARHVTPMLRS